jgi:mono/diheme cytochrome c family protein
MRRTAALLFVVACAAMFCLVLGVAQRQDVTSHARRDALFALVPLEEDPQGSTVVIASRRGGGPVALVADADEQAVVVVDLATRAVMGRTPLEGTPAQLLVTRAGAVMVALRDQARVVELEVHPGHGLRERASIPTCDEPFGLAEAPDGTVLVTCALGHALQGFDATTRRSRFTVDLPREPRSVRVSRRFRRAYVAHVAEPLLSVVDLAAPERGFATFGIVAAPFETEQGLLVPNPVQGYALAGFGDLIVAPHARAVTGDATVRTRSSYGGEGEAAVLSQRGMNAVVLDGRAPRIVFGPAPTCLLPRAAVFAAGALLVACADSDEVESIRGPLTGPALAERRGAVLPGQALAMPKIAAPAHRLQRRTMTGDFDFQDSELDPTPLGLLGRGGERRGRTLVGAGITGLAFDPSEQLAVVWAQDDRTLGVLRVQAPSDPAVLGLVHIERTAAEPDSARLVALGRKIFHTTGDGRIARDGRACASCHPDGLDDGLTWATPDGPRQTPTLRGRVAGTAPYGWLGRRETLPAHIEQTIERLGGRGLLRDEIDGLAAYLTAMRTPVQRALPRASRVEDGAVVFAHVCADCHEPATGFSDGESHDVKSRVKGDLVAAFDTPSLRRVGATAPYFHDGRYEDLRSVLIETEGTMWREPPGGLRPGDFESLLAYVRSL